VVAPDRTSGDPGAELPGEAPMDGARMAAALRAAAIPVALTVVAVTALVLAVSLSASARYRATARIVQDSAGVASGDTDQRALATSLAFLNTPVVRAAAANEVPGTTAASLEHKVTGVVQSNANVIDVSATDGSASRAAAIANAMAGAFLDRRAEAERASIARTRAALQSELVPGTPADQAAAIRTQLSELAVQSANAGSDLQLAEAARAPSSPYAPRPLRNAVIAFFATLFVAVVAVLVLERLRPRARGPLAVGRLTGLPVLATLPSGGFSRLTTRRKPASTAERVDAEADEAMWSLVGAILLELPPAGRHVLLVASPRPGQGSARVAAGLARALARAGHATLALSTDGGSTGLARELAAPTETGAGDPIAVPGTRGSHLNVVQGRDGVAVVPQNGMHAHGAGLLGPGAVDVLFSSLEEASYGYVVIEAPGLLTDPEPRLLAGRGDAIVLVCPEGAPEHDLVEARAALAPLRTRVLGVVVTPGDGSAKPAPAAAPAPPREGTPAPEPEDEAPAEVEAAASPEPDVALAELEADVVSPGLSFAEGEAREVLERLRAADRPLTTAEVRAAMGNPPAARVRSSLRWLVERGEVVRTGNGRRGDPYVYLSSDRYRALRPPR
jgi:capsular polysaccharide biosynthesis protein